MGFEVGLAIRVVVLTSHVSMSTCLTNLVKNISLTLVADPGL